MNFKNIVECVPDIKYEKKTIDISTWTQYKMKNGQIQLNPPYELSDEEKQQEINCTLYNISLAIGSNMQKYRRKYDELHGEGAYDRLYYLEPIYPNLDVDDEDEDTDDVNVKQFEIIGMNDLFYEQNSNCY